jgi:hypothetical protein
MESVVTRDEFARLQRRMEEIENRLIRSDTLGIDASLREIGVFFEQRWSFRLIFGCLLVCVFAIVLKYA